MKYPVTIPDVVNFLLLLYSCFFFLPMYTVPVLQILKSYVPSERLPGTNGSGAYQLSAYAVFIPKNKKRKRLCFLRTP